MMSRHSESSGGPFDIAIIGAGAAGIAAGHAIRQADKSKTFVILEAQDRAGGRAHTDNHSIPGLPVDLGAEWFIETSPIPGTNRTTNPLYDLAAPRAAELGIVADDRSPVFFDPGSPAPVSYERLVSPLLEAGLLQGGILAYGALAERHPEMPDVSVEELAALAGIRNSKWFDFAAGPLVNEHGAPPDKLSTMDIYRALSGEVGSTSYLIRSGMGNFVNSLVGELPVQLNTPVKRIRWQRAGGVRLETAAGTVDAKAVIVTAPIGVLTSTSNPLAFEPALPARYVDAFHQLPMGVIEKIWLSFSKNIFDTEDQNIVGQQLHSPTPGYQFRLFGNNVVGVIVGGALAEGPAREGKDAQIAYAKQAVAAVWGSDALHKFQAAASSGWLLGEYSQGAYSHALPAGTPARELLGDTQAAKSHLANQIFFAGEATAKVRHGGLPGAWVSGQRAAAAALEAVHAASGSGASAS